MCFTKRTSLDSFSHLLLVKCLGISDFYQLLYEIQDELKCVFVFSKKGQKY